MSGMTHSTNSGARWTRWYAKLLVRQVVLIQLSTAIVACPSIGSHLLIKLSLSSFLSLGSHSQPLHTKTDFKSYIFHVCMYVSFIVYLCYQGA
mgnify:CR=1 FL=1